VNDGGAAQIGRKFAGKEYRDAFAEADTGCALAAQIAAMRGARGWTQEELARRAGMRQERVSVLEDPSYARHSLRTLRRVAEAFDVALLVRFVSHEEMLARAVEPQSPTQSQPVSTPEGNP
jgi:transcriptional regulator with XRE-family HTH domain